VLLRECHDKQMARRAVRASDHRRNRWARVRAEAAKAQQPPAAKKAAKKAATKKAPVKAPRKAAKKGAPKRAKESRRDSANTTAAE
jgi:hypothetical protein